MATAIRQRAVKTSSGRATARGTGGLPALAPEGDFILAAPAKSLAHSANNLLPLSDILYFAKPIFQRFRKD
jgi:hypothetical protein